MKKKKLLPLLTLVGSGLMACSSSVGKGTYSMESILEGRELKKSLSMLMSYDPRSFDYSISGQTRDGDHFSNFVDGLYEMDRFGLNYIPSLAKSMPVVTENDDGKPVYTITLKDDLKWVTNKGKEKYDVKAQDWETTAKRVLSPSLNSQTSYMYHDFIDGATEYYLDLKAGKTGDFSKVGIKAINDKTIQFTLADKYTQTAFLSALTYSCFLPISNEFLNELDGKGKNFGTVSDLSTLLYNGAYLLKSQKQGNKYVYHKNPTYWGADSITTEVVNYIVYPADAVSSTTRTLFESGTTDSFTPSVADETGYSKYVTGGTTGSGSIQNPVNDLTQVVEPRVVSTVWFYVPNLNRDTDAVDHSSAEINQDGYTRLAAAHGGNGISDSTADKAAYNKAQAENTKKALNNTNFRLGLLHSMPRRVQISRSVPKNPKQWLRNTLSYRELVSDHNGQDYIDHINDVYETKNIDEAADVAGRPVDDGNDVLFDAVKAKAYFEAAKAELGNDVKFPVQVDYAYPDGSGNRQFYEETAKVVNGCFTKNATGAITGRKVACETADVSTTSGYQVGDYGQVNDYLFLDITGYNSEVYTEETDNLNYDLFTSGWGPDYADPTTFLNIFSSEGYMLEHFGLEAGSDEAVELLESFDELLEEARALAGDPAKDDERLAKLAEAEHHLIYELGIITPHYAQNLGHANTVSRVIPYQIPRGSVGLDPSKLKNIKVAKATLTKADRVTLRNQFEADKAAEIAKNS